MNEILNNKKIILLFSSFIMFGFLFLNIPKEMFLWELPDEAGYMWIPSYLSGKSWDCIAKHNYFGFGYGIFLLPAYWLSSTGNEFIWYSNILNILFVIGTFIVNYAILLKVQEKRSQLINKSTLIIISFISCINPYVISAVYKSICESCLVFFLSLLVYSAILITESVSLVNSFLFSFVSIYITMVHSRAIVAVLCTYFIVLITMAKNKKNHSFRLLYVILFVFILGTIAYYLKNNIISYKELVKASQVEETIEDANVINASFISTRIEWFFSSSISDYFGSLCAKIAYFTFESFGLNIILLLSLLYRFLHEKKICLAQLLIVFISTTMKLATLFSAGVGLNAVSSLYGRYYEYTLSLIIALGLVELLSTWKKITLKYHLIACICICIIYIQAYTFLSTSFPSQMLSIDTSRISAISFLTYQESKQITYVIPVLFYSVFVLLFIYYITTRHRLSHYILCLILCITVFLSIPCINSIKDNHNTFSEDSKLANMVSTDKSNAKCFFLIDDSFTYSDFYYVGLQVMIFNRDLIVLDENTNLSEYMDLLPAGSYVFTYKDSPLGNIYHLKEIGSGEVYKLFKTM